MLNGNYTSSKKCDYSFRPRPSPICPYQRAGLAAGWVERKVPGRPAQTRRYPYRQGWCRKSRGFQTKCHKAISQRETKQSVETVAHVYQALGLSRQASAKHFLLMSPFPLFHLRYTYDPIPLTFMTHLRSHSSITFMIYWWFHFSFAFAIALPLFHRRGNQA